MPFFKSPIYLLKRLLKRAMKKNELVEKSKQFSVLCIHSQVSGFMNESRNNYLLCLLKLNLAMTLDERYEREKEDVYTRYNNTRNEIFKCVPCNFNNMRFACHLESICSGCLWRRGPLGSGCPTHFLLVWIVIMSNKLYGLMSFLFGFIKNNVNRR